MRDTRNIEPLPTGSPCGGGHPMSLAVLDDRHLVCEAEGGVGSDSNDHKGNPSFLEPTVTSRESLNASGSGGDPG